MLSQSQAEKLLHQAGCCWGEGQFTSLSEARAIIEEWRIDYNTQRPHSSLNHLPPDLWAQRQAEKLLHPTG